MENAARVCWTGKGRVRKRGQVSELQTCRGDERAEVADGSCDIRAESGECLGRAYVVQYARICFVPRRSQIYSHVM